MALGTRNQLLATKTGSAFGTGAWNPTAFTPTANTKLLAIVAAYDVPNSGMRGTSLTLSDSQGYFGTTAVAATTGSTGWSYGAAAFYGAVGGSPASTTLTIDCGSTQIERYHVFVYEWTGADATVRQVKVGSSGTNTGAKSITLDSSPLTGSDVISALILIQESASATTTPGTGWTELYDSSDSGWSNVHGQGRSGSVSAAVGWDDVGVGATGSYGTEMLAVEVWDGSGGSSPVLYGSRIFVMP